MSWSQAFLSLFIICAISCSSTKNVAVPVNQLVLTLDKEETVQYLAEKYKMHDFYFVEKLAGSDQLYLWEFKGPRSKMIQLKQQLAAEIGVKEVSNLAKADQ